jgi:hypothetical protein
MHLPPRVEQTVVPGRKVKLLPTPICSPQRKHERGVVFLPTHQLSGTKTMIVPDEARGVGERATRNGERNRTHAPKGQADPYDDVE